MGPIGAPILKWETHPLLHFPDAEEIKIAQAMRLREMAGGDASVETFEPTSIDWSAINREFS